MTYRLFLKSGTHRVNGVNISKGNSFVSKSPLHKKEPERFTLMDHVDSVDEDAVDATEVDEENVADEDEITIDNVASFTVSELRAYAETMDIDLDGTHNKAEIVERVEAFLVEAS